MMGAEAPRRVQGVNSESAFSLLGGLFVLLAVPAWLVLYLSGYGVLVRSVDQVPAYIRQCTYFVATGLVTRTMEAEICPRLYDFD